LVHGGKSSPVPGDGSKARIIRDLNADWQRELCCFSGTFAISSGARSVYCAAGLAGQASPFRHRLSTHSPP